MGRCTARCKNQTVARFNEGKKWVLEPLRVCGGIVCWANAIGPISVVSRAKTCQSLFMAKAAITSKGQITIPAEIRRQMNLEPKDRVVFTLLPNGATVMRAKNRSISTLAGSLKSTSKKRVAIKDMKMQ